MKHADDCPGKFKCHGPASFCNKCGDVTLICDDPNCEAHLRGDERRERYAAAKYDYDRAAAELRSLKKTMDDAEAALLAYDRGNPVMVGRT